jgi:hypothetical protein
MRIFQWVLMILGWWSGGFLLSAFAIRCRVAVPVAADRTVAAIDPLCPKPTYKCWVGSLVALACGVAWALAMAWKPPLPIFDYFVTVALGAILGATVARILCPK